MATRPIHLVDVLSTILFFWTFIILPAGIIIDTYCDVRDDAGGARSLLSDLWRVRPPQPAPPRPAPPRPAPPPGPR
eukprot:tig00001535_g9282.t1